jgi:hypothetical protein
MFLAGKCPSNKANLFFVTYLKEHLPSKSGTRLAAIGAAIDFANTLRAVARCVPLEADRGAAKGR